MKDLTPCFPDPVFSIPVLPIPTSAYPTPAKRPAFSVIDKYTAESVSGIKTKHWRKQLSEMMDDLTIMDKLNLIK